MRGLHFPMKGRGGRKRIPMFVAVANAARMQ